MVFCAEFCPWMTDMKEVKEEEEEGLLEREASRLVRLTKPTSNYRHIGIFCKKKGQKLSIFKLAVRLLDDRSF